jgi:hypothetical protein
VDEVTLDWRHYPKLWSDWFYGMGYLQARNAFYKLIKMLPRVPRALWLAFKVYKLHHKIAWQNAKGYFKLALAWPK